MAVKQRSKTLKSRQQALSDSFYQLKVLNTPVSSSSNLRPFEESLATYGKRKLTPVMPEALQVNVGKLCNQSCAHCHVDAGPDRTEVMSKDLLEICIDILTKYNIPTLDITGGAPELNPNFRWFVEEAKKLDKHVIDRCNLTIIVSNPRFHDLPDFFAEHEVQVISSLPSFNRHRTDSQRGEGVFKASIEALTILNAAGYGRDPALQLDLVYNPTGTFLPSSQSELEAEYKRQLKRRYGIDFNHLYCITNLPINRFLEYLLENDVFEEYMHKLVDAYNPATIDSLMCRNSLSISWDGFIYDCDFNQMLDLKVASERQHILDFDLDTLMERFIVMDQHCYGCTAGAGSSCGGEVV